MTMTVTIPEDLAAKLTEMAERQGATPEALVVDLLAADVEAGGFFPSLEEVVARIQALPPSRVIPAQGSLLEYLESTTINDPDFDSDAWDREWALIEAEMKAGDLAHELEERLL